MVSKLALVSLLASAAVVSARTDLAGCTSSDGVATYSDGTRYATRVYYVPDSGEICELLDCGGGRAPPKTTVPGCPLYAGTATYSPSYLSQLTTGQAAPTSAAYASASGSWTTTGPVTTGPSVPTTILETAKAASSSSPVFVPQQSSSVRAPFLYASSSYSPTPASQNPAGQTQAPAGQPGNGKVSPNPNDVTSPPNAAPGAGVPALGLLAGVALGAALL